MYKVIIADDEKKVCQLINLLIDWREFDMEVVGIVNNGMEALEMAEKHMPDLIITDIRMPGLNGLEMIGKIKELNAKVEFIVISGYRHFEYAQRAIQYGVYDYLLKPIKKDELASTLNTMRKQLQEKNETTIHYEQMKKDIETNVANLRKGLISELLFRNRTNEVSSINGINLEYHYNFQEGCFQILSIKLDHVQRVKDCLVSMMEDKIVQLLKKIFQPICYDLGIYFDHNTAVCILNYAPDNSKAIRKQMTTIINESIIKDVIYQKVEITIGLGTVVEEIVMLKESYKRSEYALQQRLLFGANRVLEFDRDLTTSISDSPLFYTFNQSFTVNVSNLDIKAVTKDLEALKKNLLERSETTGHEILQMAKEVCNVYLLSMRSNKITLFNVGNFMSDFSEAADDCSSANELFQLLNKTITDSLSRVLEDKKQMNTKPIRMAKQYIESNYMKPLTLDEVSSVVGFNTTYFSTVFKKETGITFLEYLSNVRMNRSKELLRETNKNIAAICEEVGYSDVKYFTRSFIKHTSLKPNEFRKLYS